MLMHAALQKICPFVCLLLACGALAVDSTAGEIHLAIHDDRFDDAIKLLGEDPRLAREKDHQQNKPLHIAALKGATNVITALLAKGAEVNARNKFGQTPLHRAMITGDLNTVKLLIIAKAEISGRDNQGLTPIHLAAQRKHGEVVQFLLEHGAEFDAHDAFRRRPMHMSIMGSSDDSMQALIKAGADYKYADAEKNNYLHLAAGGGSPALVTMLLELNLGVNSTNSSRFTPAHFAAQNGHWEVLAVLDKWGGDFTLRTNSKRTPLDLVSRIHPPFRMQRHDEVQAYLERWHARQTNAAPKAVTQP